jgi:hypothetical protein
VGKSPKNTFLMGFFGRFRAGLEHSAAGTEAGAKSLREVVGERGLLVFMGDYVGIPPLHTG